MIKIPKQIGYSKNSNDSVDYLRSLKDPFTVRGVRMPSTMAIPSQIQNIHGNVNFTTNSNGFGKIQLLLGTQVGTIYGDNGATLNESTNGSYVALVVGVADILNNPSRIVSAGLRIRSIGTVNSDAGLVQAYASPVSYNTPSWDVFRDSPNQKIYSKGEVATIRYYPFDETELLFGIGADPNRARYNHNIGFLIKGAPNTTFDVEYSYTVEYISVNNTDIVPHAYGPSGDPRSLLPQNNNLNRASDRGESSLDNHLNKAIKSAESITQMMDFAGGLSSTVHMLFNALSSAAGFAKLR